MAQVAPASLHLPRRDAVSHVPSHDLDAEMSVLGAVLPHRPRSRPCSEHLKAADFYRARTGDDLPTARAACSSAGEPVDAITVTAKLEEEGQLELVGGRGKIHEIAAWASATGNAAHYAQIVRDHSLILRSSPTPAGRSRGSRPTAATRRTT